MRTYLREDEEDDEFLKKYFRINKSGINDDFIRWGDRLSDFMLRRAEEGAYDADLDPYEEDEQQVFRKGIDFAFEFDESESKYKVIKTIWDSFWSYLDDEFAEYPDEICTHFQNYLGISDKGLDRKCGRIARLNYDLQQEIVQTVSCDAYEFLDPFIKQYEDDIIARCDSLRNYFELVEEEKCNKQDAMDSMAEFGDDDDNYDYGI